MFCLQASLQAQALLMLMLMLTLYWGIRATTSIRSAFAPRRLPLALAWRWSHFLNVNASRLPAKARKAKGIP